MAEAAERFKPCAKKKTIYVALAAVFFLACSGYIRHILNEADQTARAILDEWADSLGDGLARCLAADAREMRGFIIGRQPENQAELFRQLSAVYPGQLFFYLDEDNQVHSAAGENAGQIINPAVKPKSRVDGAALTTFLEPGGREELLAEIIPLPVAWGGYLVRVRDGNDFARNAFHHISVVEDCLALFDKGGRLIASADEFQGHDRRDDGGPEELSRGVPDFIRSGAEREFIRLGRSLTFNNYLLVDRDSGLVLGANIAAGRLLPFFGDLTRLTAAIFLGFLSLLVIAVVIDIVNDREKARERRDLSRFDLLTGLLNEPGMQITLKDFFSHGRAIGHSLICFDLINFSRFNTLFGYSTGDRVLRSVAGVLRDHCSSGARISGDLFVCLTRTEPYIIEDLDRRLRLSIEDDLGEEYLNSISFKYGLYPVGSGEHTVGEVYDGAMAALKKAKSMPKSLTCAYDHDLRRQLELHRRIEQHMLHALSAGEFQLYVQPKYDIAAARYYGGEVLVRWQSADLGLVMPNDFIPLFEKNGFIIELDFHILDTVFKNLQWALGRGLRPVSISVNQSRATIVFPNYLERLKNIIQRYTVPTSYVELEITESFLAHDYEVVLNLMHLLKAKGFSLALDDFGAGYSSLNSLREMPVDTLKIDKHFLDESDTSTRSRSIIKNIINMSHELGVEVVCEGVETEQQVKFLTESGCKYIQGYYYAKPIPYNDFVAGYLLDRKPDGEGGDEMGPEPDRSG